MNIRACLKNGGSRRKEAHSSHEQSSFPRKFEPPYVGCYGAAGIFKHALRTTAYLVLSAAWLAGGLLPAQTPAPERLLFGASLGNYWPGNVGNDVRFFTLMREAGVTHTGLGFNWDNIEKERGKYNWATWDYAVAIAARFDIAIQGVIVGCPTWALPKSGDLGWLPVALNMPRDDCVKDFEDFVTTLARRYAGKVERFAFWNEPNGYNMAPTVGENHPKYPGKVQLYTRFLKITYRALKAGNPKAVLACGGIDSAGRSGVWLTGLYENGAKEFMDAVAIHPYSNDPPYFDEAYIKRTRAIMLKSGDGEKPVWMNEYGTFNPNQRVIQSVFDTIKTNYPYVTDLMLHTFQDFSTGDGLQPWGLIDLQLSIKPTGGYEAFKAYPKPPRETHLPVTTGPCRISGKLTDVQTRKPVSDVYVVAMPGAYFAQSDKQGVYLLAGLPTGTYQVSASAGGFNRLAPVEVNVSGTASPRLDLDLTRDVFPLGEGETFDPAKDRADNLRLNLVANGSFDQMETIRWGEIGVGWHPFNTVQRLTYTAGGGVGGQGLSQMLGHSGAAIQEGIYQVVPTVPGRKYRLTFWFAYRGEGEVGDPNNCSRAGVDFKGGEWATIDPQSGKTKYGFPKTLQWKTGDLARECDGRAGGKGKGEKKWWKFTVPFVAEGRKTSIWLEGSGEEWHNTRKFFDEVSVVPVDD